MYKVCVILSKLTQFGHSFEKQVKVDDVVWMSSGSTCVWFESLFEYK